MELDRNVERHHLTFRYLFRYDMNTCSLMATHGISAWRATEKRLNVCLLREGLALWLAVAANPYQR